MSVDIETVGIEAAALLAALHRRCLDTAEKRAWSETEFTDLLELPTTWSAIAVKNQGDEREPVGFVLCSVTSDEVELLFVGVVNDYRRQGVGESLLSSVNRYGRKCKAPRVLLEVAADNVAALRLYAKSGFFEIGQRPGYYRIRGGKATDAILMQLAL